MIDRKEFFIKKYNAMVNNNDTDGKVFDSVRYKMIEEMIKDNLKKIELEHKHELNIEKYDLSTDFGL